MLKTFIFVTSLLLHVAVNIAGMHYDYDYDYDYDYTVVWSDYKFYRQMLWVFFHPHLLIKSKASAYMSRHLHIKSKTITYTIGTCFRLYMQMRLDI